MLMNKRWRSPYKWCRAARLLSEWNFEKPSKSVLGCLYQLKFLYAHQLCLLDQLSISRASKRQKIQLTHAKRSISAGFVLHIADALPGEADTVLDGAVTVPDAQVTEQTVHQNRRRRRIRLVAAGPRGNVPSRFVQRGGSVWKDQGQSYLTRSKVWQLGFTCRALCYKSFSEIIHRVFSYCFSWASSKEERGISRIGKS